MECLDNIVGITQIDHPCLDLEGADTPSQSGLYLDDLEGGINLKAISNSDSFRSLVDMAEQARATAIKKFEADIQGSLNAKYKDKRKPFRGIIGRPSYNKSLPSSKDVQFLKISPRPNLVSVLKIDNLKLIINSSITTDIIIVDGFGTEYLNENITTVANTFTTVPVPADFSLVMDRDYFITWDRNGTNAAARNVKISCGCSGPSFEDYIIARGGEADTVEQANKIDQYTHGFSIAADIRCSVGNIVCMDYDENNAIALTSAWAILYKMGEILNEFVLNSGEVNRYTMMNREYLWGKRNHFRKEYEDRINYLAESIDLSSSDCFICKNVQLIKAGIFS